MKTGYAIEKYGVYQLRIEGDRDFSKMFGHLKELHQYAKQNSIKVEAVYEG